MSPNRATSIHCHSTSEQDQLSMESAWQLTPIYKVMHDAPHIAQPPTWPVNISPSPPGEDPRSVSVGTRRPSYPLFLAYTATSWFWLNQRRRHTSALIVLPMRSCEYVRVATTARMQSWRSNNMHPSLEHLPFNASDMQTEHVRS
jgi:hypothetical protein